MKIEQFVGIRKYINVDPKSIRRIFLFPSLKRDCDITILI